MKAKILIPDGWLQVRRGYIRKGDLRLDPFGPTWEPVHAFSIGQAAFLLVAFLIRKTTRRAKR